MVKISSPQKNKFAHGFTLLELLVVISIMGILMTVVIWNQSKFSDNISVGITAQNISEDIRQAQVYGSGVRGSASGDFSKAYGVHFISNSSTYTTFVDSDNSGTYNDGDVGTPANLDRGNKIDTICVITTTGYSGCAGSVDVTFIRPNPNAVIQFPVGDQDGIPNGQVSKVIGVIINLISAQGKPASVTVYTTGQISVQ